MLLIGQKPKFRTVTRLPASRYPAMTVVGVSAMLEPEARVEIEVTAVVPE